ncbi:DUF5011 domain-containing protein [Candidatus Saccharibacteria bacterium]|nr:DUF5011 domain-containing protein [Candidatus Saccharibacteria bacterium]
MKIKDKKRRRKYQTRIIFRTFFLVCILMAIFFLAFLNYKTVDEIIIDKTAPEIVLFGKKTVTILAGEEYNEPGFCATDNGEDITGRVKVEGEVNNDKSGEYYIEYSVVDDSDNKTIVKRKIIVEKEYNFATKDPNFYLRSLENYIKEKNWKVSIGFYNFDKSFTYYYNASHEYYGASLIKPVAGLYAYEKLSLNDKEKQQIRSAISISDNDAYFAIADRIGLTNLRKYGEELGLENFMTDRSNAYFSDTTVKNQIILWKKIWDFVNTSSRGSEFKSYFVNDEENYIKFDDNIPTMHKYGFWGNVFHDVGIVLTDSPYIVVVLTEEGENDYEKIIHSISKKLFVFNKLIQEY